MVTLKQQITLLLSKRPGLTDREITNALRGPSDHQQPINQAARNLASKGTLIRRRRNDGLIGNYLSSDQQDIPEAPSEPKRNHDVDALSEDEIKEEVVVEETTVIYPLKSFVVNLLSRNGTTKNYLKVTMEIELSREEYVLEIEKQKAKLRDAVLMLLSSKTLKDISTVEGKLQLKQELLLRMNIILGQGTIKKIYFSEFVVQ